MPRFAAAFTPPDAIANLQATASGAGVSLTWDPTTLAPGDFVAYHVSRSIADGPFVELASQTDPADVDFVDFAAPLGVPLTYRLVQQSIDNLSDPTDAPTMVDAWIPKRSQSNQTRQDDPTKRRIQTAKAASDRRPISQGRDRKAATCQTRRRPNPATTTARKAPRPASDGQLRPTN